LVDWPQDRLELALPHHSKKVQVSLLGLAKNLPAKWKKGKLIIDTSGIGYNELPSKYAWTFRIK